MPVAGVIDVVVVGVDGSDGAVAALRWAAEIVATNGTVVAVHAASGSPGSPNIDLAAARDDVTLTEVLVDSPVAVALLDAARTHDAELVVIGAHEQRRRVWRRLGAVAHDVLTSTDRPVAVVAAQSPDRHASGTVVAGVGVGEATRAALDWAGAFAASHGTGIELIKALPNRPVFREDGLLDVVAYYVDPELRQAWAAADLQRAAADIQASTDVDLDVRWSAPPGSKGPELVEASADAAVLVVGLHERPHTSTDDVPAWLRRALVHAPCPVVIVPPAIQR